MDNPYFDRTEDLTVKYSGLLPHWNQFGKLQFVTFRLADSLPQAKIQELKHIKKQFVETHPLPWSEEVNLEYYKLIGRMESKFLDNGYGSCILKEEAARKIVSDALKHFDGSRYELIAYVIMPNHVHILLQLIGDNVIEAVIRSIKGFTSKKLNGWNSHTGRVWQKEYYDRIIRNGLHFRRCVEYIIDNPKYLSVDEFELYVKE